MLLASQTRRMFRLEGTKFISPLSSLKNKQTNKKLMKKKTSKKKPSSTVVHYTSTFCCANSKTSVLNEFYMKTSLD